jgi:hypothetical protein
MTNGHFDKLVSKGVILNPASFSDDDKKRIESLTPAEVDALISIRAKLGDKFLQEKAAGPTPAICIVF